MRTDIEDGVDGVLVDLDEAPRQHRELPAIQKGTLSSPATYSDATWKIVMGALLFSLPAVAQQAMEAEKGSMIEGILIGATVGFAVSGVVLFTRGLLLLKRAAESA